MLVDYDIKTLTASAGASRRIIQRFLNDQLCRSQATRDDVYNIPTRTHRVSPLVTAKSAHGFHHNTDTQPNPPVVVVNIIRLVRKYIIKKRKNVPLYIHL